ncbi:MAG: methionine--tRNA ligase [Clostridiales bacterium]|nr:methionine--tRNA ligase [Clostridiales bacterium]MDY2833840.1 methionine--tRNA ligase [Candidatus Aphodomonas sp.]
MADKGTYYITTPIYYPSANAHIGHCYTTVAADTMARFKKLCGYDTYFLTGSDEHGQKIERKAAEKGVTPQQFVDEIVANFKKLWELMEIDYDDFIRTTDKRHEVIVQKIFRQLYEQGDIYKGEYEGWYCTPCEAHWTETQLKEGHICPDCGRPVERVREEAYFFKTSKYQDWLIQYIEEHPDFIQPASRATEMLSNFLRPGLQDLCVTRTSFKWGIPVDFDPKHVIYVWLDALSNYITALGWGSEDDSLYRKYWPANVHLIGKEIVRFHVIYWPIMLHALGLPLPKQVFGHGWLVFGGEKMSKSKGNVVDPNVLCARYSVDAIRYFLMREMPFGADGNFTNEALLTRMNADLANDLGNLVSRTVAMIVKYFGGLVPPCGTKTELDAQLEATANALAATVEKDMDALQFSVALTDIWKLIGDCNKYIDANAPWVLAKDEANRERLGTVLYHLAECVRIVAVLVGPFMPNTPARIFAQLGVTEPELKTWDSLTFGGLKAGTKVEKGEALFPRIDIPKELEDLAKAEAASQAKPAEPEKKEEAPKEEPKPIITIDDFDKLSLKVALVTAAEKVKKSDKLLQLTLKVGEETRTVLSGIASQYTPEEMVGKKVVLLYNLAPRKMRGIESQGMVLCGGDHENFRLLTVDGDVPDGSDVN